MKFGKSTKTAVIIWTLSTGLLTMPVGRVVAATFTANPGDYATASNWSPAAVPTGAVEAAIGIGATRVANYTTSGSFTTTGRLLLGNSSGTGTLNMSGSAGTLTFGGNGSSTANFIGVDTGVGTLDVDAGTLNFGTASTLGYLRIGTNGSSTGLLDVSGGTVNIATSANMGARFDNGAAAATSSGTLTISGTGVVNIGTQTSGPAPTNGSLGFLYMKNSTVGTTGSATVNLNGGTLSLVEFAPGTVGTKTVNLNGGILQARANTTTFMTGLTAANVENGGAIVDTNGFNITIGQSLLHGAGATTDSLTKNGLGILTLTGANTYTGGTTVSTGTLVISGSGTLANNAANTLTINSGGTVQMSRNDTWGGSSGGSPVMPIVINAGGTMTTGGSSFNVLGPLTLNGGTLTTTGGANSQFPSWALRGTVTVGGSTASTISAGSGSNNQINLGANTVTGTTFDVADATGDANTDLLVSAVLQNGSNSSDVVQSSSLTKTGSGTLTLSGANTYTGATNVNFGTLLVNGSTHASSAVTVGAAGTLGGTGTVFGTVALNPGATISPGNSIGTTTTGSETWSGGNIFEFEFSTDGSSGTAGSAWDLLSITGSLDMTGATSTLGDQIEIELFTMLNSTTPGLLGTWDETTDHIWTGFVTTTAGISGFAADKFIFDTAGFQNPLDGVFSVQQSGNNLDLLYTANEAAVPEPASVALWSLLGLGLVGYVTAKRRQRLR